MLAGLGVAGDVDTDVTFLEDTRELIDEVVDDLYVRRFHWSGDEPVITHAEARTIGRIAVAKIGRAHV
jgi:exodeoxyribonuclease V beta subunit